MNQPVPNRRVFKFGSFEADLDGGVLTKSGIRIKLQDQPFQILALLLERPGQVVTREEIRQKLWSENTFVEFDDGLNTAVRKLRAALGDSADNPRFLETVPRRGYRFVAPVIMPAESPGTVTEVRKEPILSDPARADSSPVAGPVESPLRGQHQIAWYAWRAAGLALFAVAAIAAYGYLRKPGFHVTARDTIVLADFENTTGEPVFDDALKQGLQVGLEQSPSLSILSERKTGIILRQMGRSPDERMTGRTAIEVCQRTGSKVAVQGSISSLGTTYLIGLGAIRCDNGEPITHQQVEANRKEQVVVALGEATTRLRARLGESVPSLQKYNSPLEQATTPSLEALNAYGTALSTWDKKGDRASLPFLQRALDLDPNFAMAYGAMATIYHNLGEDELARKHATRAYELRGRVTETEKSSIEARYHLYVTGDVEKAAQVYETWAQNYPESAGILNHLGPIYAKLGRYDKAASTLREAIRLDPTRAATYGNLAVDLLAMNRVDDASAVLAEADARKLQTDYLLQVNYWTAFVRGDTAGMQRFFLRAADESGAQSLLLAAQAKTEAYYGHFQKARELSRVAADLMVHEGDKESAAAGLVEAAVQEAESGFFPQARRYLAQAEKMNTGKDVTIVATVVTARIGELKRAQDLSEELNKKYPEDTGVQKYWLPIIRAAVDLQQGRASQAIEALEPAAAFESGDPTVPTLYPAYVRGQAYLAAGDPDKAAGEFQKLIDHPGIVLNFQLGALAHLGSARAYSQKGDKAKARDGYRDFLQLWKDADPDIPILKQARAEYAKLQ